MHGLHFCQNRPDGASEYVAVDIGLIGPNCNGSERKVSICAKDNASPYDFGYTTKMVEYAEKAGCDYAVDVFNRYRTDGTAALHAGNHIRTAAFGMAVYCSHGMERRHITGLEDIMNLLLSHGQDTMISKHPQNRGSCASVKKK